ncbi:MAG: hypothetical protein IK019_02330, partial [Clostridia bacterium]|nr:hypothetical protein [Clostridia bacterium]
MAKYIDPTVYVISISDDVRKRLQSIRKYASFAESKAVGDVIFYFWMEAPTSTVYISFCVYPTFMPPQEIPKCTVFG